MEATESNMCMPCAEEALLEQSLGKIHDIREKDERINNQLVATITRYMECVEYISTEIRTEECSSCGYRQIVKEIAQAGGLDE